MDLGNPGVRSLNEIVQAFDPTMVFYLLVLMAAELVFGVINALRLNEFDWDHFLTSAKENILYAAAWGVAFVYSESAGTIVYGLILAKVGFSVVSNITDLFGVKVSGPLGQLVSKGPGDSTTGSPGG